MSDTKDPFVGQSSEKVKDIEGEYQREGEDGSQSTLISWASILRLVFIATMFAWSTISMRSHLLPAEKDMYNPRRASKAALWQMRGTCAQPSPPAQKSNLSSFTDAPGFAKEAAERLAGAVRVPTMSFDDMGPVGEDERWAPFKDMERYLQKTFPLVHKSLEYTLIAGHSPVYVWHGSVDVKTAKPLMLTGHVDVVPSLTALDRWTYPPFSGTVDEEWIYGRGAGDCKNNVVGILTAVEHLLKSGWKPKRTIILAFGQDEEISGPRGAANIAKVLLATYGYHGIGMIVDEGGMGLETIYGQQFALPGIAEKGYLNLEVQVDMLGGHSSVPSRYTSIGILSKVVSAIEDADIFSPRLKTESPIWGYLSCVARYGDPSATPAWIREGIASNNPDMEKMAQHFAEMSLANRYLVQTSKAATIFHGGLKSNALPETSRVLFNSRVDIFSTPAETADGYRSVIATIAQKYSLTLDGEALSDTPSIGNITVFENLPHVPSPIAPFTLESEAWTIFSRAVQASFGEEVITAPSAMTGNTDTRHYVQEYLSLESHSQWHQVCSKYGTRRYDALSEDRRLNIHTVDEKLKIQTHVEGIKFYTELILQSDALVSAGTHLDDKLFAQTT